MSQFGTYQVDATAVGLQSALVSIAYGIDWAAIAVALLGGLIAGLMGDRVLRFAEA